MRVEELLVRLNRRARSHYCVKRPITLGIFRDWCEADVVVAPPKQGQKRRWSGRHYRRALEVVRLKAQGLRSLAAIRIMLFLRGYDVPAFDFETRSALTLEYIKLRNKLFGNIHST